MNPSGDARHALRCSRQEPPNPVIVPFGWSDAVRLPVTDGITSYAQQIRHITLPKAKHKAPVPDLVSKGL